MFPKSVVSRARCMLVAALAISAVALGGCAETTSGQIATPAYTRVAGNAYHLNPAVVEVRNENPKFASTVAQTRSVGGRSDRFSRTAVH